MKGSKQAGRITKVIHESVSDFLASREGLCTFGWATWSDWERTSDEAIACVAGRFLAHPFISD